MLLRLAALLCFPAAAARPQPSSGGVLASLLRHGHTFSAARFASLLHFVGAGPVFRLRPFFG